MRAGLCRLTLSPLRRRWLAALVVLIAAPGLWWRTALPPANDTQHLTVTRMVAAPGCCSLGPLRLEAAWQLDSANDQFHGYSALVSMQPGELTAFSDRGYALTLRVDGAVPALVRIQPAFGDEATVKNNRDIEAATFDPATRRLWLALESRNAIVRHRPDLSSIEHLASPPQMRHWPSNTGPEGMVRLADGRFLVLSEDFSPGWFEARRHPALLFPGEPGELTLATEFRLDGPEGYRPTDVAQLPDGRVLILMRHLVWPFPPRFAGQLVLADPAAIRAGADWPVQSLGMIDSPIPVDNYEGLAIVPRSDGTVTVWIISDDNQALTQGTYLLRFRLDPAALSKLR